MDPFRRMGGGRDPDGARKRSEIAGQVVRALVAKKTCRSPMSPSLSRFSPTSIPRRPAPLPAPVLRRSGRWRAETSAGSRWNTLPAQLRAGLVPAALEVRCLRRPGDLCSYGRGLNPPAGPARLLPVRGVQTWSGEDHFATSQRSSPRPRTALEAVLEAATAPLKPWDHDTFRGAARHRVLQTLADCQAKAVRGLQN